MVSNRPGAQPHPSQRARCRLNQMCSAFGSAALFSLSSYIKSNFSVWELNGDSHQHHHPFGNFPPALWQGLSLEAKPSAPGPGKGDGALSQEGGRGWWLRWGSRRALLWAVGSAVPGGEKGRGAKVQAANAAAEQEGQDPASHPHPASCWGDPVGEQSLDHPRVWWRWELVAFQRLGAFLCFIWMGKAFLLFWCQKSNWNSRLFFSFLPYSRILEKEVGWKWTWISI